MVIASAISRKKVDMTIWLERSWLDSQLLGSPVLQSYYWKISVANVTAVVTRYRRPLGRALN